MCLVDLLPPEHSINIIHIASFFTIFIFFYVLVLFECKLYYLYYFALLHYLYMVFTIVVFYVEITYVFILLDSILVQLFMLLYSI